MLHSIVHIVCLYAQQSISQRCSFQCFVTEELCIFKVLGSCKVVAIFLRHNALLCGVLIATLVEKS